MRHAWLMKVVFMSTVVALGSVASDANAYDVSFAASAVCMRWSGAPSQDQWPSSDGGVENYGTGVGTLHCGVNQDVANRYADIRVYYTDASSGEFGQAVFCRGQSTNVNGSVYYVSSYVYGCSTTGGCASSASGATWSGSGYLLLSSLYQGPLWTATAHCKLPAAQSGPSRSVIHSLYLQPEAP